MIWCVEDDASIRDIEIYTLKATGYEAQGFPDGESFFTALKIEQPDLVLLDVMLPGEDGLTILQRHQLQRFSRHAEAGTAHQWHLGCSNQRRQL